MLLYKKLTKKYIKKWTLILHPYIVKLENTQPIFINVMYIHHIQNRLKAIYKQINKTRKT
jgi:hypothetical protein